MDNSKKFILIIVSVLFLLIGFFTFESLLVKQDKELSSVFGAIGKTGVEDGYVLTASSTSMSGTSWTLPSGSGTVTSVAMTTPTGLSISGSPITGAGTLALDFTSGYNIPLTASTTDWQIAYNWGNHATVKSGTVNLAAGGTTNVTFTTAFSSTPEVVATQSFATTDFSTTLSCSAITVNGFTLNGEGNAAGNVSWIATNAGNP